MRTHRRSSTSFAAFFATALLAPSPALSDDDGPRVFAAQSQTDTAGQIVTTRELLAIGSRAGKPFVRISNGVATASFAADVSSDGEIANDNADPGLICYDMATAVVAAHSKDPTATVPLYVRFLDKVVAIPLTVNAQDTDGTSVLSFEGRDSGVISNGQTALASGLLVRGRIEQTHGAIDMAVFDESSIAGSPAVRIGGTSCSLTAVVQSIGT